MKTSFVFLVLLASVFPAVAVATDLDDVVSAIARARPPDWECLIDQKSRPPWARSAELSVELTLYGPALGGYSYLDYTGKKISERRFSHEAIRVWVTPKGYNSGWNVFSSFINWFKPWHVAVPDPLVEYHGISVYCMESYHAEKEQINEASPEGTVTAVFSPPSNGRTWLGWRSDILQAIINVTSNQAL